MYFSTHFSVQFALGDVTWSVPDSAITVQSGSGAGGIIPGLPFFQHYAVMYDVDNGNVGFATAAVPEPSAYAMALAGLACGGFTLLRRYNASLSRNSRRDSNERAAGPMHEPASLTRLLDGAITPDPRNRRGRASTEPYPERVQMLVNSLGTPAIEMKRLRARILL